MDSYARTIYRISRHREEADVYANHLTQFTATFYWDVEIRIGETSRGLNIAQLFTNGGDKMWGQVDIRHATCYANHAMGYWEVLAHYRNRMLIHHLAYLLCNIAIWVARLQLIFNHKAGWPELTWPGRPNPWSLKFCELRNPCILSM